MGGHRLDSSGSRQGLVIASCENSNENSSSIQRLQFIDLLRICRFSRKTLLHIDIYDIFPNDLVIYSMVTFIIVSIQPLGSFGQEPELSQATGMALVRCILSKFLGVVCHCFPPRLDVPTFAARCLDVRNDARDPSSERWNYGRERLSGNFPYMASLFTLLGIFYMLQRKAC